MFPSEEALLDLVVALRKRDIGFLFNWFSAAPIMIG
jgi:hypothetical protein